MFVFDNFLPSDISKSILLNSRDYKWNFGRSDNYKEDLYWTKHISGLDFITKKNLNYFLEKDVEDYWSWFKLKFEGLIEDKHLVSCYANALTYGVEGYQHIDTDKEGNGVTVIYYVCDHWNSNWCGETAFFSGEYSSNFSSELYYTNEIIKSVLPKYNRAVIFDSSVIHAVRPISRSFKGLRVTLMLKLTGVDKIEMFKKCS